MSTRPSRPIRKGRSCPARSWGVSESLLHHAPAPGHLSPGGRILGRPVRPHTTACPVWPPVPHDEGESRQIENKPDFHHLKQFLHACPLVVAVLKRNEAQGVPGRGVPANGTFLACADCLIGGTGCEVSQCAARPANTYGPLYWPGEQRRRAFCCVRSAGSDPRLETGCLPPSDTMWYAPARPLASQIRHRSAPSRARSPDAAPGWCFLRPSAAGRPDQGLALRGWTNKINVLQFAELTCKMESRKWPLSDMPGSAPRTSI
jgi:hypothetical protein